MMMSKRGRISSSSSACSSNASDDSGWATSLPIDVLTEILSYLVDTGAPRGSLADCARPCAREHARTGRALAAVSLTCTSWRAGVEESIIWRSLFYERWTIRHTTKQLARAMPLPAGEAVARRARQLLTYTGTANRRGPRASTALVCDVCTCCAVLASVPAAKKHLRTHHGFGISDDEEG